MKPIFHFLLLLLTQAAAHAGLYWEKTQMVYDPTLSDRTVTGEFVFMNTGTEPVTIDRVQTNCGCTSATLEKRTWQPGEKGRISTVFTIGSRQGVQVKPVAVSIRGEPNPTVLTMVIRIPTALMIDPPMVWWEAGDEPKPKTMKLTVGAKANLRVRRVSSNDPRMETSLESLKAGEYRLRVTPKGTERMVMAILTIECITPDDQPKLFQAYAQIKRSNPGGLIP